MQRHQFLHRGAVASFHMEHLVEIVQPLGIGAQQMRVHPHTVPELHLLLVDRVGFHREAGIVGGLPIGQPDPQPIIEHIRRLIEHDHVVGKVHVAVIVDPLRQDGGFMDDREGDVVHGNSLLAKSAPVKLAIPCRRRPAF